jgi:hypothetical protein
MATHRKAREAGARERELDANTPTMQDEADILEEVGAERDEETGDLVVDEETVRKLGAVDATSVRENRRLSNVIKKKRDGKKDVPFGTRDPMVIYDTLLRHWTPDSININCKRMLGGAQVMITSHPVDGTALYEAIKFFHGQHAETEYEIKFTGSGQYRGTGRITMPDTRTPAAQQGQPMQQPYYPNGGAPPGYVQVAPPPVAQAAQAAPSSSDPMAMMTTMFELFQRMQAAKAPQPQFQVPPAAPQAPLTDPAAMMSQMFDMFQRMQGQVVAPPVQPQFVAAPPQPAPPPPPQPSVDPMAMMSQMFDMFQKMQATVARSSEPGPSSFRRPPYDVRGDRGEGRPHYQGPPGPPQPPQRPPTMAEQFRESIGVVRSAMGVVQEMESMLPSREQESPGLPADDDDSPVRVIDTGPAKIVVNKSDGSTRLWETGMANMDKIFKWVGEQHEVIQKAHAQKQPQRQQLPPGYVEVGPDYKPPPGYVAVPVEERQDDLPPPPANVPPPVSQRAAWGAPTVPEDEN